MTQQEIEEIAKKTLREVFRFDIPSGSGDQIGTLAYQAVYGNLKTRQLILSRLERAIAEAARVNEKVY